MKRTLLIFSLLLHLTCFGQLSISYSMGGISLGASAPSSFAGPIVLSNDKSCLQISNGVIVFSSTSRGSAFFDPTCNTPVSPNSPIFSLAPNPSQGFTRLYVTGSSISPEDNVTITVSGQLGHSAIRYNCKGAQLKNGFPIETNQLSAGVYLVSVFCSRMRNGSALQTYSSTLKLINNHL
jgi:hypothetical protein